MIDVKDMFIDVKTIDSTIIKKLYEVIYNTFMRRCIKYAYKQYDSTKIYSTFISTINNYEKYPYHMKRYDLFDTRVNNNHIYSDGTIHAITNRSPLQYFKSKTLFKDHLIAGVDICQDIPIKYIIVYIDIWFGNVRSNSVKSNLYNIVNQDLHTTDINKLTMCYNVDIECIKLLDNIINDFTFKYYTNQVELIKLKYI